MGQVPSRISHSVANGVGVDGGRLLQYILIQFTEMVYLKYGVIVECFFVAGARKCWYLSIKRDAINHSPCGHIWAVMFHR